MEAPRRAKFISIGPLLPEEVQSVDCVIILLVILYSMAGRGQEGADLNIHGHTLPAIYWTVPNLHCSM